MLIRNSGMILLITILVLGLLSAMLFSMQRAMWLQSKLQQKTFAHYEAFEALETVALTFPAPTKKCFSDVLDVNYAANKVQAGEGCMMTRHHLQYRYWVNELGYPDGQKVLAIRQVTAWGALLVIRFSERQGVMSWRYLVD